MHMYSYIYIHLCICIYEGAKEHNMCESLCQFITHHSKIVWENASPRTTTQVDNAISRDVSCLCPYGCTQDVHTNRTTNI